MWLNGNLVPPQQATVSVYDHGLLYGDGCFEGIRIYGGRIFKCATHLRRLFDSAKAIRLTIPYTPAQLTQAIKETCKANARTDGYIRLCVTRGAGPLGLNPFTCEKPNVFIIVESLLLYPQEMYDNGMAVVTASTIRNHPAALSPRIKSLNYLNNILAKIEAIDAGVPEAIMLNHMGFVAECTADNLFLVKTRGGESMGLSGMPRLLTPPLHAGALEGVTMNAVIDLAVKSGLTVERLDLTKHDLYTADEIFLTGTGAEVIAVTKVDGRTIGEGKPGPVTQKLIAAFRALVAKNAPED
ncbi:MAG: branched-chain-amino-acid transaminase [Planctomycetes bacterium]|nr:branched-chain-amino-acid transaminase [Planctomycetota bacterium]